MAKIALFLVLVCVCIEIAFSKPPSVRDATEPKRPDVSKEIDDAVKVLKTNFEHLLKTVQDNEMFKGLNEKIQQLSTEIAAQGQQFAKKLHDAATK